MKSLVAGKLKTQAQAIDKERRRLAAIHEAEKKVRIEAEQERLRKEAEKQRIEMEQQAMMDWERYQPPPPPQVTISALTDDDPPKAVVGALTDDDPPKIVAGDDRQLPIPAEKLEELRELLKSIAEDPAK